MLLPASKQTDLAEPLPTTSQRFQPRDSVERKIKQMSSPTSTSTLYPASRHKYVHEMSSSERLDSLLAWAETKKYIYPGEGGTFPTYASIGGTNALVLGGSSFGRNSSLGDRYGGQYEAPVGPPGYSVEDSEEGRRRVSVASSVLAGKKRGVLGRWVEKRRARKEGKGGLPPGYVP
jgi:hypothetical protein